ncbi:MAG: imelysin family protein [Myxococcota bacterium]
MLLWLLACVPKNTALSGLESQQVETVLSTHTQRAEHLWQQSESTARTLYGAVTALIDAPSQEALDLAKNHWRTARWAYSQAEVLRYQNGPIDRPEGGVEHELNSWPLDEGFIDSTTDNPNGGLINAVDHFPALSIDLLRTQNTAAGEESISTGFHAIEFLLWGQDAAADGPGQRPVSDFIDAPNADRRRQYLALSTELLVNQLQDLSAAWGGTHRSDFLQQPAELSLKGMWTALVMLSGDEMAGERMAVAFETQDQEDEQSCFSDNTLADLKGNMRGIQRVYSGDEMGPGLMPLVKHSNPTLAVGIQGKIANCTQYLSLIPEPFDQSIVAAANSEAHQSIDQAITCLEDLSSMFSGAAVEMGLNVQSISGP